MVNFWKYTTMKKAINRDDMFTDIIDIAEITGARHKSMFLVLGELKSISLTGK